MFTLRYHPVLGDAEELVVEAVPARLLVVGDAVPGAMTYAGETRLIADNSATLPTGVYLFPTSEGTDLLVVTTGSRPAPPDEAHWLAEDHSLLRAHGWFLHWWESASAVARPRFELNSDVVTVPAGQAGVVRGRTFAAGSWAYSVRVEGRTLQMREQSLADPPVDDDPASWMSRPAASVRRFAATLTRAKLRECLSDTIYSFRASRTLFRPYQFRPAIRLLAAGSLRLLIADEVGLGKTIEAGLVWTELDARGAANRTLVVCPSMLVSKWQMEMDERFGFELRRLRREQLDEMLDMIERDRLPPRFHAVVSLETLRVWPGLERLGQIGPHFDLVVVDEAHSFRNSDTASYALGALLSDWADALVFLSATPLNLGNDDLFNLLQLLAPGDFDDKAVLEDRLRPNAVLNRVAASLLDRNVDNPTRRQWLGELDQMSFGPAVIGRPEFKELRQLLGGSALSPAGVAEARRLVSQLHALSAVVTRTRKIEIQDQKAVREAIPIHVTWTPAERAFYEAFEAWQVDRARRLGLPVGFVTQMPLRLASSCLPAARDRVLAADGAQFDNDLDSGDEEPDEDPDMPPADLVALAQHLGDADTKYDQFLPHLLRIVEQRRRVLVFTFSRATLAYLERRLRSHVKIDVLHGGVKSDDRHLVMRRFRQGEFDVLLASRVASEGLDFEFCSAVVNYDLPWNPMEVEQRIGRVDRFGQTDDKVLILNFQTPGTIETDIVIRLMDRIGVFKDSIGELEPILQSRLAEIRNTAFDFSLSHDQRARRLDEMMVALEEQQRTRQEVDTARQYLSSTDDAEIDGFEDDLLSTGRYVGQPELVLLIEDWAAVCPGATCEVSSDGEHMTLRGTLEMEQHLRAVQARGERSAAELDELARKLRDEQAVTLSLDQETARTMGEQLLSATHPLTRAALGVPGHTQARYAHVSIDASDVPPGRYLSLISVARWTGLRQSSELWTAAVDLESSQVATESVGLRILANLAEAKLAEGTPSDAAPGSLDNLRRIMLTRQATEEDRRRAENDALVETRRISLRETHARKVRQIQRRIDTLVATGKSGPVRLFEAQLRNQDRLLDQRERELEGARVGALSVEHLAVCTIEVRVA